jgi:large subunit ribosomal protein L13
MAKLTQSTRFTRTEEAPASRAWYVVDVKGKVLGRAATRIATVLKGKHKPTYSPHVDMGDFVVVLNASQIRLTGKKLVQKSTYYFTGFPAGHKRTQYKDLMVDNPEQALKLAVKGMLPKNTLGRNMISKLKIYKGEKHSHAAQNPQPFPVAF